MGILEDGTDPIEEEIGDPPRLLLSGVCQLAFEGQTFVPDGEPTRRCWLEVSEAARVPLAKTLGPDWMPEFDEFHAEFWGTICWSSTGFGHYGHLGMFEGRADMDELVSARIIPPPPSPPRKKHNGIRARLEAGSTMKR